MSAKREKMDQFIKQITPKYMGTSMINIEEFLALYQEGGCEFVDIRMDFEREVWELKFGLKIPLNELSERQGELPKDKRIVLGCPTGPRSIVGWTYLRSEGYDVVFLKGGLDGLVSTLKGGQAKAFLGE
jgi:rhodanese-related sulfurtransferase